MTESGLGQKVGVCVRTSSDVCTHMTQQTPLGEYVSPSFLGDSWDVRPTVLTFCLLVLGDG